MGKHESLWISTDTGELYTEICPSPGFSFATEVTRWLTSLCQEHGCVTGRSGKHPIEFSGDSLILCVSVAFQVVRNVECVV